MFETNITFQNMIQLFRSSQKGDGMTEYQNVMLTTLENMNTQSFIKNNTTMLEV